MGVTWSVTKEICILVLKLFICESGGAVWHGPPFCINTVTLHLTNRHTTILYNYILFICWFGGRLWGDWAKLSLFMAVTRTLKRDWCVLERSDAMLTAGSRHNVVKKKGRPLFFIPQTLFPYAIFRTNIVLCHKVAASTFRFLFLFTFHLPEPLFCHS